MPEAIKEAPIPPSVAVLWTRHGLAAPKLYAMGALRILVSRDLVPGGVPGGELRWHLSISHPSRYPTWDELGRARDALLPPELAFCVPHPPRSQWLSLHPNCFHLWEVQDAPLLEQWRLDGAEAQAKGYGVPQPARRQLPAQDAGAPLPPKPWKGKPCRGCGGEELLKP